MSFPFPDTLVLKIEEFEFYSGLLDTTLYVWYDNDVEKFMIRGKRRDTEKAESATYSFQCEFAHELVDFIGFVLDQNNLVTYVLYNYDNLPVTSDEITFHFLASCDTGYNNNDAYEIAAYENQIFQKRDLVKHLRMLRSVSNPL